MAFNFNWSPLAADASFYERARELLTAALNKYPKPPIIVDDILVNELNLGSVPPELEILEIGDLAEDRFRGIFKMSYSGDAFLTLKTKVQANPLNTYLSAKPSFASPQPLAASSGLTIPLQITLSAIRLSAFIILVFSKQKGVTLVFRNDPLESLKVSSTFDSIPFVREYLQKEIEGQLRTLLMEEVPAIIHRLSLRLWVPELREQEGTAAALKTRQPSHEAPVNPLSSPPQNSITVYDSSYDQTDVPAMSLESGVADHVPRFSQKNLLRLAVLRESQRTLSLFTPTIQDAVFRAWTGSSDRGEAPGVNTPATPSLSRSQSTIGGFSSGLIQPTRPTWTQHTSFTGLSNTSSRSQPHRRKRKNRVVNLRRNTSFSDTESISGESSYSASTSTTNTAPTSEPALPTRIHEEAEDELVTPPSSPPPMLAKSPFSHKSERGSMSRREGKRVATLHQASASPGPVASDKSSASNSMNIPEPQTSATKSNLSKTEKSYFDVKESLANAPAIGKFYLRTDPSASLLPGPAQGQSVDAEWIMRMASEIARKSQKSDGLRNDFWASEDISDAPPAYEAR